MSDFFGTEKKEEKKEKPVKAKEEVPTEPPLLKKRKGTVTLVSAKWIFIEVNGTGERIAFDPIKHATLKKGDSILF